MSDPQRITELLGAWSDGDGEAYASLMPLVYAELHRRAARFLRQERSDHTLQPTALVHEAYLRMLGQREMRLQDRAHFFALAARMMRRVLLDHARKRGTEKRGGRVVEISLEEAPEPSAEPGVDVLVLDDALTRLAAFDPQGASVVELRFFGGLSIEETAAVLGSSAATVTRRWRAARAWLYAELAGRAARPLA